MRVLEALRLSRQREESTSFPRQREDIKKILPDYSGQIVYTAEDMDVSAGTVDPFSRPGLGPYLNDPEKISSYDAIAWAKLDRAIRNMMDLNRLATFAVENKKVLIFASGPGGSLALDFRKRDPITNLILQFLAFAAELEWIAISERNKSASDYLRSVGRYKGGPIPFGYMKVRNPDGEGFILAHDPVSSEVIKEAVRRVIDGETSEAICRDFTSRGILTPKQHSSMRAGKPVQKIGSNGKPITWGASALTNDILRSRNLLGETEYFAKDEDGKQIKDENGKRVRRVVRDSKGLPVLRGEPLITYEDFDRLQAALDRRGLATAPRRHDANPLLGVAKCIKCGANFYRREWKDDTGKVSAYYYCATKTGKDKCTPGINSELLEQRILQGVVSTFGHLEVMEKRYVPGEDYSQELAQVDRAIAGVRRERDLGFYEGDDQGYEDRLGNLISRRKELLTKPSKPAGWNYVPTGKSYKELFTNASLQERRALLIKAEVIAYAGKPKDEAEKYQMLSSVKLMRPASQGITDIAGPLALHMFFDEEIEERIRGRK